MTGAPGLTYHELKALNPCEYSFRRVTELLGGAEQWNGKKITAREAREAGATFDEILWAASQLACADKDVERRVRLLVADCAAHVLHLFERERPTDMRPRSAIIAARQFARGEITKDVLAAARAAAWAARFAAWAAARAARFAAWAAARDAAWAARDVAWATRDAERAWQFDRLIARLSEDEPEDYPLPEPQQ